jgi:hypothetical protein
MRARFRQIYWLSVEIPPIRLNPHHSFPQRRVLLQDKQPAWVARICTFYLILSPIIISKKRKTHHFVVNWKWVIWWMRSNLHNQKKRCNGHKQKLFKLKVSKWRFNICLMTQMLLQLWLLIVVYWRLMNLNRNKSFNGETI